MFTINWPNVKYNLIDELRLRSAETVCQHLHHPAKKTINGFLCLLIVFLKS